MQTDPDLCAGMAAHAHAQRDSAAQTEVRGPPPAPAPAPAPPAGLLSESQQQLLGAARTEIQRLRELNRQIMEAQGGQGRRGSVCRWLAGHGGSRWVGALRGAEVQSAGGQRHRGAGGLGIRVQVGSGTGGLECWGSGCRWAGAQGGWGSGDQRAGGQGHRGSGDQGAGGQGHRGAGDQGAGGQGQQGGWGAGGQRSPPPRPIPAPSCAPPHPPTHLHPDPQTFAKLCPWMMSSKCWHKCGSRAAAGCR